MKRYFCDRCGKEYAKRDYEKQNSYDHPFRTKEICPTCYGLYLDLKEKITLKVTQQYKDFWNKKETENE